MESIESGKGRTLASERVERVVGLSRTFQSKLGRPRCKVLRWFPRKIDLRDQPTFFSQTRMNSRSSSPRSANLQSRLAIKGFVAGRPFCDLPIR